MERKKYYTYIVASHAGTLYLRVTSKLYVRVRRSSQSRIFKSGILLTL